MSAHRGLLLDFGSVIMKSFFETRRELERHLGLPTGTLAWCGPLPPHDDTVWQGMQRGEITERDYWHRRAEEVGRMVGESWTIREFCLKHNELPLDVALRPEADRLVRDAKRCGLKVGILTNELELFHGRDWLETIPMMALIDFTVDATHTHILKPDPRAYQLALEAIGLPAEAVVFIDDQVRNVRGGEAVGIASIHLDVTDPGAAFARARQLLDL